MGAGAGAGSDCADPTCGAEWCGRLGDARIGRVRELGDVRLRAVGDAPEGGREALRRSDRKPRDVLVAVGAGQIDGEGGVRSAVLEVDAASKSGLNGRLSAQPRRWPSSMVKN